MAASATLSFPAFGGFNALRLGTMQVAVWATGAGDTAWRRSDRKCRDEAPPLASGSTVLRGLRPASNKG